jgi:hypothetical protein
LNHAWERHRRRRGPGRCRKRRPRSWRRRPTPPQPTSTPPPPRRRPPPCSSEFPAALVSSQYPVRVSARSLHFAEEDGAQPSIFTQIGRLAPLHTASASLGRRLAGPPGRFGQPPPARAPCVVGPAGLGSAQAARSGPTRVFFPENCLTFPNYCKLAKFIEN